MTNKIKGIALLYEWMVSNIEDLKKFNYKVKKQHLAFVDHSFHIKTRSGDFLRNIFKEKYIINDYWVDKNLKFDKKILIMIIYSFFKYCLHLKF